MSLNIKDERVHDLVREAARRAGLSQTRVVAQAIEEYLARLEAEDEREARLRRLDAVFAEIDRNPPTDEDRAATKKFMEEMYDENGFPV